MTKSGMVKLAAILLFCLGQTPVGGLALGGESFTAKTATRSTSAVVPPGAGSVPRRDTALRLRPVLAVSTLLLGAAAVVLDTQSDRTYSRYLDTADPRQMSSYYDSSERKRNLSTAALVGAELSAIAFVATYLVEKPPPEPQPGGVIISLAASPGGLALRASW